MLHLFALKNSAKSRSADSLQTRVRGMFAKELRVNMIVNLGATDCPTLLICMHEATASCFGLESNAKSRHN